VLCGFGSFLERVLGDAPENLINYLGGDWLRVRRAENLVKFMRRAKDRREAWGVEAPISPSLMATLPRFRSAADERHEWLRDLWARLLAAAMDPSRTNLVRQRFAEAIRILDPPDTRVLAALIETSCHHQSCTCPEMKSMSP
jgi:Abortive infection alpha